MRLAAVAAGLTVLGSLTAPPAQAAPPAGIHWKACTEAALHGLQCGALTVPLDPARPGGRKISIAVTRARHRGKHGYQGVLLLDPGGPGGSGRAFSADVAAEAPASLRAAYDLIGFDPRGVGGSRPALSCEPDYFKPVRPDYVPRSPRDELVWLERSKEYADACGRKYGSLLDHMKTVDAVRDMDALRVALHQQKINYFGASYGTYLGAVYATLYPHRVRRMVLDSNVRPSGVWYGDNLDQDYAFDASVRASFGWIAAHAAVYHLGTTETAVEKAYYSLRARLRTAPIAKTIGPDELDDTWQVGAYLAPAWPLLAQAWSDYAVHGKPAKLLDRYKAWGAAKEGEFAVYNAVQCSDTVWPQNWGIWRSDAETIYRKAPYQAWGNTWFNAPCLYWPAKPGTPVKIGATAGRDKDFPKILLFQATLDAATPYSGGLEMHKLLPGSRLVIEDGGRTHAVVLRGNACIDTKFTAYLKTGRLPADMTRCRRLPDPVPASGGRRPGSRIRPELGLEMPVIR